MSSSARWILLLAVAGVVAGVAFWLGGGLGEPTDGGVAGVPRAVEGSDRSRAMELPPPVSGTDSGADVTPKELAATPADPTEASSVASAEDGPRVVVIGRLVSPQGRPIEGARVALMTGAAPRMQALFIRTALETDDHVTMGIGRDVTDRDGAFRIDAPLPAPEEREELPAMLDGMMSDKPRLFVEHADFVNGDHAVPTLVEGEVDAGVLVLQGAGRIIGRVMARGDEGSALLEPVVGARLAAQPAADDAGSISDLLGMISGDAEHDTSTGVTDADGVFELGGLPPGLYDVAVHAKRHPRFQLEDVRVEVGRATPVGDMVLEEGSELAGVVRDGRGDPVPGLRVSAQRDMSEGLDALADFSMRLMLGDMQETVKTDDEGRFGFAGISDGRYDLKAGGRGTGWSEGTLDDVPSGTLGLELGVHLLGDLLVSVRSGAGGAPVAVLELEAERVEDEYALTVFGAGSASSSIETPPDDEELAPGEYLVKAAGRDGTQLTVRADGYATTRLRAPPVRDAGRATQAVLLMPESRIEGVVVDDAGRPVADATVEARLPGDASDSETLGVNSSGGSSTRISRSVTATSAEDSARMKELLGLTVGDHVEAVTDEAGRFRLNGLSAGGWEITASADGFVPCAPRTVALAEAEQLSDVELVLAPGGTIRGTVKEVGGLPVEDAQIHIALAGSGGINLTEDGIRESVERNLAASFGIGSAERRTVRTDQDGGFEARGLSPGDYSVTLKKASTAPISLDLGSLLGAPPPDDGRTVYVSVRAREESRADFVRARRASVQVSVTADGEPVVGASVSLSDTASSMFGIDLSFGGNSKRTDSQGRASFVDLEPATYKVTASAPGAVHVEDTQVEVAAGREEHVVLTFGGVTLHGRVLDEAGEPAVGVSVRLARAKPESEEGEESGGFLSNLLGGGNVKVSMNVQGDDGGSNVTREGADVFGLTGERITTDGLGEFRMKYLSPGAWQVSAEGAEWIGGDPLAVEIGDAGPPERITLHVRRGATVRGQVIEGSTEESLDGVEVQLQQSDGSTLKTTVSKQGMYTIQGVPTGEYVLVIEGEDGDRARREVRVQGPGSVATAHLVTLD